MSEEKISTEEVLRQIKQQGGKEAFMNPEQLLNQFAWLSKNQLSAQLNFLRVFTSYDIQGINTLFQLKNANNQAEVDAFGKMVQRIRDKYFMQEAFVLDMCSTLWRVVYDVPAPDYAGHSAEQKSASDSPFRPDGRSQPPQEKSSADALCSPEEIAILRSSEDVRNNYWDAKQGNIAAQMQMCRRYLTGDGVPENFQEGMRWYTLVEEHLNIDRKRLQYNQALKEEIRDLIAQKIKEKEEQELASHQNRSFPHQSEKRAEQVPLNADGLYNCAVQADWRKDYAKSFSLYLQAAQLGHASAMGSVGYAYATGRGIPQSDVEAAKWYRQAAEMGIDWAQYNLGYCYEAGNGVPQNYAEAVKWYRKAADQGFTSAQNKLGTFYETGTGVPKNNTEAEYWYSKAAEQGYAGAQCNMGRCFYYGIAVSQNYAEAEKWYRKAADQGNANAQNILGHLYEEGYGVPKNASEAVYWYRKAADQGYAGAQDNLGRCYYSGIGVQQNYAEAVKWCRLAAEQGDPQAQHILGCCYQFGLGVAQNNHTAREWYQKAAAQGYESSKAQLKSIGEI